MPPASIRPALIQNNQCCRSITAASIAPTAGPMVCPTSPPVCASDITLPMRVGGVLATSSAMPAGV